MNQLIDSSKHTLFQLNYFLHQIKEAEYTQALPILSQHTIGMHVRHIIEFYQCLIEGVVDSKINYDARKRNLLQQTSIEYALICIQNILKDFELLNENKRIELYTEQNHSEDTFIIQSNIFREFSYVIEHTIHHFAIIKMSCNVAFPHIEFHKDFGVAYSTIKHRESVYSNISA